MQLGPLLDRGHAAPPPRSSILQLATLCMQALTLFVVMWVMLPASGEICQPHAHFRVRRWCQP